MKRSATICRLAMVAVYVVGGCMLTDVTWAVPTPVHAYDFNGDLNDGGSGGVAITSEGGTVGDEFYEFNPQLPPGDYNTGLTLATPALSDPGVYSIEMYVQYDTVRSISDQHWIKLIDFKNATEAWGFYYEDVAFTTRRDPVPAAPGVESVLKMAHPTMGPPAEFITPEPVMTAGDWNHIVVTRDVAGEFVCYVDGQFQFAYTDSDDWGVFSEAGGVMRFLQNDNVDDGFSYYNTAKGRIDFLNIYGEALSAPDVRALAAATVPEPSTLALCGISVVLLAGLGRAKLGRM